MPDPRNLQITNRGIIDALFDADVRAAMVSIFSVTSGSLYKVKTPKRSTSGYS